jgi:L-threonylcarbamoyladenylate synthase
VPRILEPDPRAIAEAVAALRAGGVVAFPTETVYGLGGDTFNAQALARIYQIKARPPANPLIAHVASPLQARRLVEAWDDCCEELARRFWPGPLTLVLARAGDVPAAASAGLPTIAVRCPRHPVALDLLRSFGGPVSAPSANRSGLVSPTTAAHVAADLAEERTLLILDGGLCEVGIESTVLDLTTRPPRILRLGLVTPGDLRRVIGSVETPEVLQQAHSPGTAPRHYAPRTPAELVAPAELQARVGNPVPRLAVLCFAGVEVPPPHRRFEMPEGAGEYAHLLYDALRRADDAGAAAILIEEPPMSNDVWCAVRDRLRRAVAGEGGGADAV